MRTPHALLIDPDPASRVEMTGILAEAGFECVVTQDTDRLDLQVARLRPDVVVLDVEAPGSWRWSGLRTMCTHSGVPVIVTSSRPHAEEAIACLESGAIDYVGTPVHPGEMTARIRRRIRITPDDGEPRQLSVGSVRMELQERRTTIRGEIVSLTTMEFDLLQCLASNPGQVFSRSALLRLVWGHSVGDASTVTVHIRRLRAKIERDPAHPLLLRTRWGVGYWLAEEELPDQVPLAIPVPREDELPVPRELAIPA